MNNHNSEQIQPKNEGFSRMRPPRRDLSEEVVAAGESLLHLYSNNSTEQSQNTETQDDLEKLEVVENLTVALTQYHKRQAHTLFSNVERLVKISESIGHLAFFTLTFPDNVTDHREAYKRFRSFNSHFLAPHPDLGEWVCTKERQKRGAWHYHMVIQVSQDIRKGIDFQEIEKGRYSSASPFLRDLWSQLREALPKYGLGRSELIPIKSNAEAIARYVGKYISKHIGCREQNDKGVRLVNYSRGWTKNSIRFAWNTKKATIWRRCLAEFARQHGCTEMYQLTDKLGSGWAYKYAQDIGRAPLNLLEEKPEPKPHQDTTLKRITENKGKSERYRLKNLTLHVPKAKTQSVLTEYDKDYCKIWVAALHPSPDPDPSNLSFAIKEDFYCKLDAGLVEGVEKELAQPPDVPF